MSDDSNGKEPRLPIEIFGIILEILHISLNTKEYFRTISRCCQVSKLFKEICSPFLFRNGVQLGPTTSDRRRISHLRAAQLLEIFPPAYVHIRSVAYNFDFRQPKDVAKSDHPWPSSSCFLQLPNVTSISFRCDGRHSLSQETAGDDEREIFPVVSGRGYRLLLEHHTTVQTVTNITFGHIRQIPTELIIVLPRLKVLNLHFCSLLEATPSFSGGHQESPLSIFVATYTDFSPSFFHHCPDLEKIDVQGANPSTNKLHNPLTTSVVGHNFSSLKEISTDCTLPWKSFLPDEPAPGLLSSVRKVNVQLDDDGAIDLIDGLLDRVTVLEEFSVDMDLVRNPAVDLSKRMKAWRKSLKHLSFSWNKNKEPHLKVLCDALDLRKSVCRVDSVLRSLELRTSIDIINPDNMFDHDTSEWRRLDDILLGQPQSFPSLHNVDFHVNINRICREIRKEFTPDTARDWTVHYVNDWLEQVPVKNLLGSTTVGFRTHVSSFALMFPGRDGEE